MWYRKRGDAAGRADLDAAEQPQALTDDEAAGIIGGVDGPQAQQTSPCGVQNCVCTTSGSCCSCQGHTHVNTYR